MAEGAGTTGAAERVGVSRPTVIKWRDRFAAEGIAGLDDEPRSGRPKTVDDAAILAATLERPPKHLAVTHWSTRLLGQHLKIGDATVAIILAELGADGTDGRLRRAAEAVLADAQHAASGGFSVQRSKTAGGGLPSGVIPCLTGNLVFALVRLGMLDEPRVQAAIDWIATYQRFDDGDGDPCGWPYDRYEMCWGRHTCSMGVVKALKGLAEIPPERRSAAVEATLNGAAEFMLIHHVHKRSHDLAKVSKPGWTRFGFPRMYQTDALEILWLLTRLGYRDPRMDEALDLVCAKRDKHGRWNLDDTFNDRFSVPIETRGQPSRWVTLRALEVLTRLGHG